MTIFPPDLEEAQALRRSQHAPVACCGSVTCANAFCRDRGVRHVLGQAGQVPARVLRRLVPASGDWQEISWSDELLIQRRSLVLELHPRAVCFASGCFKLLRWNERLLVLNIWAQALYGYPRKAGQG